MEIKTILSSVGEYLGIATQKTISFLSKFGVDFSQTQAKIINIVLSLLLIWGILKLVNKPLKWLIIVLLAFLVISSIFTFI